VGAVEHAEMAVDGLVVAPLKSATIFFNDLPET